VWLPSGLRHDRRCVVGQLAAVAITSMLNMSSGASVASRGTSETRGTSGIGEILGTLHPQQGLGATITASCLWSELPRPVGLHFVSLPEGFCRSANT
jgi:hypothetical protein